MTDPAPQRGTEARRREIAEAALRSLQRYGHVGLTARRVASEAGLSLGHLTYNFNGMDEILAAAYQLAATRMQDQAEARLTLPGATHAERLEAFLRGIFSPEALTPAALRVRIDLWAAAQGNATLQQTEHALNASLRARVEELLARMCDSWKAERIPQVADLIMATMDGLWLDYARRADEEAVKSALGACVMFAKLRLG
jgi:DNA-binding transcriptional regulator YbjK